MAFPAESRLVNFFTAKRLMAALHVAVQRYEAAFRELEIDVLKRILPKSQRRTAPAGVKSTPQSCCRNRVSRLWESVTGHP